MVALKRTASGLDPLFSAAEADGLPVGVQLIGRRFADARLLAVGRTYERAYGWLPQDGPRVSGGRSK